MSDLLARANEAVSLNDFAAVLAAVRAEIADVRRHRPDDDALLRIDEAAAALFVLDAKFRKAPTWANMGALR